jgi:hypothetical protein
MMNDLSTSLILLVLAIVLLWLAVTDKLSRVLDAWEIIKTGNASGTTTATVAPATQTVYRLPSLPTIAINPQVQAV